jgi:hypothetical protein
MTQRVNPLRVCLSLFLITVLCVSTIVFTGCGKQAEGRELAETGQKAAGTLSAMYQQLAKDANEIWELEAFNAGMHGGTMEGAEKLFSQNAQKRLSDQINALNSRARMAARLADTYSSLKKLAAFDASAEVKGSAVNLAGSLNLPDIPGSPVSTSGIAGQLGKEIVNWQQSRKLKDGSRLLLKSVQGITEIYQKEMAVYRSFPNERKNKLASILDDLIKQKLVIPYPLLQQVPDSLGLSWTDPKKLPDSINPLLTAFSLVGQARLQNQVFESEEAIDAVSSALSNLAKAHADFEANRPVDAATVLGLVEKARGYLDKIMEQSGQSKK